ncbi:phosphonate ABC transporter, permease protein PhnE [Propionicicella superfundia]|uniref:phosphonate ABC transporter, permease protein PhnE n=1 Tax=Propionicicella superfundia TaxID=348582 RepID=UPI000420CADB|nr:phosphonate ABC transporter, permease protein PhnE [Propionicicella superfundia]
MTALHTAPGRVDDPGARDVASRAPRPPVPVERVVASLVLLALAVAAVWALLWIRLDVGRMLLSWSNAERFIRRIGAIQFPAPAELAYQTALTVGLVVCGTALAAVLSVPVAFLAAANTTPNPLVRTVARFVGVLARALPDVVLAMVFVLVFSLGTLPGILAIGLHSVGMISKMFADAIEQIDEGPRLAIRAAGGSRLQEYTAGVLPQVLPSWVATTLHRNDINLRGSVLLGYVGVAGLGMQMSYAFKALDYGLGLGYALVIFALCVVMEFISSGVRAAMLGASSGRPARRPRSRPQTVPSDVERALRRPWTRARTRNTGWGWAAVAVLAASVWVCDIAWGDIVTVWGRIPPVAAQFWPPDVGAYSPGRMMGAMGETIAIALAATLLSLAFSLVIGSLAARNVAPNPAVRGGARVLLVLIRAIPEIILAIVLIVITGLGAQAGTIALAFGGIGLLGKLIADSLEEVDPGPEHALTATGASRGQVYAGATVPQGLRAVIGHTFYMLDTNLRAATTLGIVGAGGVGYYLLNASQGANYGLVTTIVGMILAAVLVVESLAMWMRHTFR